VARARRSLDTPIGRLTVTAEDGAVVALEWGGDFRDEEALLIEVERQLAAYFAGEVRAFDLPLAPAGSAHERAVFDVMIAIPYGTTLTYGEVAARTGSVARAVGQACGANPIPVIIPCHRVLAANGLGGYSGRGGGETKRRLLAHEGVPGFERLL
jgi:methylated-DNA-[protein]-cysteine S-methyltransferase